MQKAIIGLFQRYESACAESEKLAARVSYERRSYNEVGSAYMSQEPHSADHDAIEFHRAVWQEAVRVQKAHRQQVEGMMDSLISAIL